MMTMNKQQRKQATDELKTDELKRQIISRERNFWFVQHIEEHLETDLEVCCKICGKTVDKIANEKMDSIIKTINDFKEGEE